MLDECGICNGDGLSCSFVSSPCELPTNYIHLHNNYEVWYNFDFDTGGFQWDVDGATVTGTEGGSAAASGFTVQANASTVLAFSFTGSSIPAGCGILTNMALSNWATGLNNMVFSNSWGEQEEVTYFTGSSMRENNRDQDYIQITLTDPGELSVTESVTVSVYDTYLSGDVRPFIEDLNEDNDFEDPGEFGDNSVLAPDVVNILKVSTDAPGIENPNVNSDLYDAFDVSPIDVDVNGDGDYYDVSERGGDGFIEYADVVISLKRATLVPGFNNIRRVDLQYPYNTGVETLRTREVNDTLIISNVDITPGTLAEVPIYISRGDGNIMNGLVYGIGISSEDNDLILDTPLQFVSSVDDVILFSVNSGNHFVSVLVMDGDFESNRETLLGYLTFDVPEDFQDGQELTIYAQSSSGSTSDYQVIMIDEGEDAVATVSSMGNIEVDMLFNEGWNWVSFNTVNQDMSLISLFSSLDDNAEYIKSQSEYADYYPEFGWFGTLDTINNVSMYKVSMLDEDNLEYLGFPVDVENTVLSLNSGWNWIGYTPQFSQEINNALSNLPNEYGVYLKSQFEYADYYDQVGWFGTLESMDPYLGYQINLNDAVDFAYNNQNFAFRLNQEKDNIQSIDVCDLNVHDYEHNGSITASLFDDGIRLKNSDYTLFAFNDDKCVGHTQDLYFSYTDENVYPLMVYGDNPVKLTFKVLNHTTGDFYDISEGYDYIPDMHIADAISPFKMNISKLPEVSRLNQPYPNPFNPSTTITYDIKEPGHIEIAVYDIQGRKVSELYNGYHESGKKYSVVFDASLYSSGVYFVKLQGNDFTDNKKIIFIK